MKKLLDNSKIYLVTGVAGFIGFYLSQKLLELDCYVIGIDNINKYYDINLKIARLDKLKTCEKFIFIKGDISEKETIEMIFEKYKPNIVVNLAAQAGVRYSIDNPDVYIQSNIIGFYNIVEACRHYPVDHMIYASSSSVYGSSNMGPCKESDFVDHPISLYAATKKSNELMAYTYSYLYKIPATGLRFFTVYGPMGRPDMAYYNFTQKYFAGEPIIIFNNGDFIHDLYRDFTYINDIVEGIILLIGNPPTQENESFENRAAIGFVSHKVYNIGNSHPEKLMDFIYTLEKCLSISLRRKVEFVKVYEPIKPGDVLVTYASTDLLEEYIGFKPKTPIEKGLQAFTDWYVDYYNVK